MSNIIDNFHKGAFLPSYMKTLSEVFGRDNIYLVSVSPDFENTKISTFIVIASNGHMDINNFIRFVNAELKNHAKSYVVPKGMVDDFLNKRYAIIIRDDYAPVDNLVAPVFEERFGYNRKG